MILQVQKEAVQSVEQDGMVFIDEIDKIVVGSEMRYGKWPVLSSQHLCWVTTGSTPQTVSYETKPNETKRN